MFPRKFLLLLAAGLALSWLAGPSQSFAQKGRAKRVIDQEFRQGNLSARERNQLKREVDRASPREVRDALEDYGYGSGYSRPQQAPHAHSPNRPQYPHSHTHMGQTPSQGYVTRPSAPAAAPAPVAPPNAAPPKELVAPKNVVLAMPAPASSSRSRKLQIKLAQYIDDTLQGVSKDMQNAERDRAWREGLIEQLNGEGANPLVVDELERLLGARNLDLESVDALFQELRLSEQRAADMRAHLQLAANVRQLQRLFDDGEDSTRIARVLRDIQRKSTSLRTAKKGRQSLDLHSLRQSLDSLSEASLLQEILADRTSGLGADAAWPAGEVTVVLDPDCSPGEAYLLAEETVLAAAPPGEEFSVRRGSLAVALGAPVFADGSLPDSATEVAKTGISIANPNTVAFGFVLDEKSYSLPASASREFALPAANIRFANVTGRPARVYSLSAGAYRFYYTNERGWDLSPETYQLTIDNGANAHAFRCLVDGKEVSVPAGQKHEHRGGRPVVVVFDRADGGKPARKVFAANENVAKVGVSGGSRHWNLFTQQATPAQDAAD